MSTQVGPSLGAAAKDDELFALQLELLLLRRPRKINYLQNLEAILLISCLVNNVTKANILENKAG